MKKLICLLISVTLSALCLFGCSGNNDVFEEKTYTSEDAEITNLQLDVRDRKIEIEPSPDDKLHITYYDGSKEFYQIDTSNGNTLTMTLQENKEWTDFIGSSPSLENRTIHLQIPQNGLSSLSLSTTNEDLALPSLSVSDSVRVSLNNGSLTFESLDVGKAIQLETKNGDISGTIVGGYDDFSISCGVKKGDSNLPETKEGGEKTLNISVNNGNVNVDFDKATTTD